MMIASSVAEHSRFYKHLNTKDRNQVLLTYSYSNSNIIQIWILCNCDVFAVCILVYLTVLCLLLRLCSVE
jgi:hypothetical protein